MFTAPAILISKEELYEYLGTPYNPPVVESLEAEEAFSDEWWEVREALMRVFKEYGAEDDFGEKDFAVSDSSPNSRGIGVTVTSAVLLNHRVISDVLGVLMEIPEAYSIYFCYQKTPLFNYFVERDRILVECTEFPQLTGVLGLDPINKE